MFWSSWPWYAQLIALIVIVIVVVYLFDRVILPLLHIVS